MHTLHVDLVEAAQAAGIKVPPNPEAFDADEFPHFHVFANLQLNRATSHGQEHFENAKVVAAVPQESIRAITLEQLEALGFKHPGRDRGTLVHDCSCGAQVPIDTSRPKPWYAVCPKCGNTVVAVPAR